MDPFTARTPSVDIPQITLSLNIQPDAQGQTHGDHAYGTLSPEPRPGSLPVRQGLFFVPAWNPADEIALSVQALGLPLQAARNEAQSRVRRSATRRAALGVDWQYLRLSVRAMNAGGEVLACQSVSGVPSDLPPMQRQQIENDLFDEAMRDAQDWAILGLN